MNAGKTEESNSIMETDLIVTIGGDTVRYFARQTTAPRDYDGFGTIEVADFGKERIVLIREEHYNWQTARYSSGNHTLDSTLQPVYLIEHELWERLAGKEK